MRKRRRNWRSGFGRERLLAFRGDTPRPSRVGAALPIWFPPSLPRCDYGLLIESEFYSGQASILVSTAENAMSPESNDKLEAYPTYKSTASLVQGGAPQFGSP